jgi:hypothetical protein
VELEEMRDNISAFITHEYLTKAHDNLREEFSKDIGAVNVKVDGMKDILLPTVKILENVGKNLEQLNKTLIENTKEQRLTNGLVGEQLHSHDVKIVGLEYKTAGIEEKKKSNALFIGTVITGVTTIIVSLIQLAPAIFK